MKYKPNLELLEDRLVPANIVWKGNPAFPLSSAWSSPANWYGGVVPGTGDIAISLGQLLPQAEVVVVTTPQSAAAEVAERSALVARQTGQTVIGVIENMAGLPQPDGSVLHLFGEGGGADAAARLDVPLLASIPLSLALREGGDSGEPVVLGHPDDPAAAAITAVAAALATRARGLAGRKLGLSVT